MHVPNQQKAAFFPGKGKDIVVETTEVYEPGHGELLIRIEATALNPIDWKIQTSGMYVEKYPFLPGGDSAGTVVKVGEGVTHFQEGDKVLHEGMYKNNRATFQQYTTVPAEIAAKIPSNLNFDWAASIPLCLCTAAVAMYQSQEVERGGAGLIAPWHSGGEGKYSGQPIFIFGGATSVGQYSIQLAKLSGFSPIIATASPHSFDLVKSCGATHTVDRNLPTSTLHENLKSMTSHPIKVVIDTVGSADNQCAAQQLIPRDGVIVTTLPVSVPANKRDGMKKIINVYGSVHVPENRELGKHLFKHLTKWLENETIKPNAVEYVPGGLGSIQGQLNRMKKGEVRAQKIVVRPTETTA